jgi:hypothetical protein
MKVYILIKSRNYGSSVIGVYSSKAAAEAKLVEIGGVDNYDYEIVDEYVED